MSDDISKGSQELLMKVVEGVCAFNIQFDGPACAMIGHTLYTALCSGGRIPEGAPSPFFEHDTAIRLYARELTAFIGVGGEQIAWRCSPRLERRGNEYRVYSRLALVSMASPQ